MSATQERSRFPRTWFGQWARGARPGTHTAQPTVQELEAQGWRVVGPIDPRYPNSIWMEREARDE